MTLEDPQVLLYVKAIHIVFVVSWFAGLFYLVRLFVYHVEAQQSPEAERAVLQKQYLIMQKRLWGIITQPAAILTLISGLWLVQGYGYWAQPWMVSKLILVAVLVGYHMKCGAIYKDFKRGVVKTTPFKMRLWNEVATLLLISIVLLIVLKNNLGWIKGITIILVLGVILALGTRYYRKRRAKKAVIKQESHSADSPVEGNSI